jgi:hypothetical protein
MKIIAKIEFDIENNFLFFPLEADDKQSVTEYGTMLLESKNSESQQISAYSESLITGVVLTPIYKHEKDANGKDQITIDKMDGSLGYAISGNLFKFDLVEYLALIKQENISEDEIKKLTSLDCYLVEKDKVKISRLILI